MIKNRNMIPLTHQMIDQIYRGVSVIKVAMNHNDRAFPCFFGGLQKLPRKHEIARWKGTQLMLPCFSGSIEIEVLVLSDRQI